MSHPTRRKTIRRGRKRFGYRLQRSVRLFLIRVIRTVRAWSRRTRILAAAAAGLVVVAIILLIVLAPRSNDPVQSADMHNTDLPISLTEDNAVSFDWDTLNANEPAYTGDDYTLTEQMENEDLETSVPSEDDGVTLRYGMENPRVTELQERLMELGFLDIDEATQYYGTATRQAVRRFQRQCGTDQDGIAGLITQAALFSSQAPHYAIKEGMSGTDVEGLQRKLKELGYMNSVTGYYGTETIKAVQEFQKRNKLSVDGLAGEKTFAMVYSPDARPSASVVQAARKKANIDTMISVAKKQLGKKYILGAEGPNSFDCSGLVYYCLKQAGSNRGRYNAAGYSRVSDWKKITSMSSLQKGDLIFFYNNAKTKVGHVGIYIGGGMMIDASSSNGKVVRRSCTTNYWKKHFVCGRRPW